MKYYNTSTCVTDEKVLFYLSRESYELIIASSNCCKIKCFSAVDKESSSCASVSLFMMCYSLQRLFVEQCTVNFSAFVYSVVKQYEGTQQILPTNQNCGMVFVNFERLLFEEHLLQISNGITRTLY
jgi:hypothetical protein